MLHSRLFVSFFSSALLGSPWGLECSVHVKMRKIVVPLLPYASHSSAIQTRRMLPTLMPVLLSLALFAEFSRTQKATGRIAFKLTEWFAIVVI